MTFSADLEVVGKLEKWLNAPSEVVVRSGEGSDTLQNSKTLLSGHEISHLSSAGISLLA